MSGSYDNSNPKPNASLMREEEIEEGRQQSDPHSILAGLKARSGRLWERRDKEGALEVNVEALELATQLNSKVDIAEIVGTTGKMQLINGDSSAVSSLQESVRLYRELGDKVRLASALGLLGRALLRAGEVEGGEQAINESMSIALMLNDHWQIAYGLALMAEVAVARKNYQGAALLWSAAEANYDGYDGMLDDYDRRAADLQQDRVRRVLGEREFEQMWAKGMQMLPYEAIREGCPSQSPATEGGTLNKFDRNWADDVELASREVRILQLLTQRLSDVEIAECLTLSVNEVGESISEIYAKLNVKSRLAARRYAQDKGIV